MRDANSGRGWLGAAGRPDTAVTAPPACQKADMLDSDA